MVILAKGQHTSVVFYMAPVPILIETDLYIDSLNENGSLMVISPSIKIFRLPKDIFVNSDQSFPNGLPLNSNKLSDIEYRVSLHNKTSEWEKLSPIITSLGEAPYGGKLVETLLEEKEQLIVAFRQAKNHQLIQETIFNRTTIIPQIALFRQKATSDTIDNTLSSKAFKNIPKNQSGFSKYPANTLILSAGMNVDFAMRYPSVRQTNPKKMRPTPNP